MEALFEMDETNSAYFSGEEIPDKDSYGRYTNCCFYKNLNGKVSCRALIDFYNVGHRYDQCGKCPFYKTEAEFKAGWDGGFGNEEDEFEEAV